MSQVNSWAQDNLMVDYHGGACCGRYHIHELGYWGPRMELVNRLHSIMNEPHPDDWVDEDSDEYEDHYVHNFCVEITLTSTQAFSRPKDFYYPPRCEKVLDDDPRKDKTWDEVLTGEFGFKKVGSFINPNTNNRVYVYLLNVS